MNIPFGQTWDVEVLIDGVQHSGKYRDGMCWNAQGALDKEPYQIIWYGKNN